MSESRDPEAPPDLPPVPPSPPAAGDDLGARFEGDVVPSDALAFEALAFDVPSDVDLDGGAPLGEPAGPSAPVPRRRWRRLRRLLTPRSLELALFLRGASLLAVVGVCLASFLMQLVVALRTRALFDRVEFVNRNQIATPARTQMLAWLALGIIGGGLAALGIFLWRRRRTAPGTRAARVLRSGRLLSPLLLPGLAWPLLTATEWEPLPRITGVAFVAFLAELCVRAAAGEVLAGRVALARAVARLGRARVDVATTARRFFSFFSLPNVIVLLGVAFYAVWMSYGTILQHRQFGTAAFNLGNYDTMFFNTLHGHPFRAPSVIPKGENWSMLSNHAELTLFALLPFYALHPGPETLLILQAVALASGAIPIYRFASRRLPRSGAVVLTLAYLLYAPMHQSNFYDVHFQKFAVPLTLWTLDMLDARRPWLFALFFALALGCREDVSIGLAVCGIFLLLVGTRTRAALMMTVVSLVYFVVIKFAVMPRFGSWWFAELYRDLYPTGENTYGGVVKTLLTNPLYVWKTLITTDKMVLFLLVVTPLGFMPLRRGLLWMAFLPAVPFTVLTTGYWPTVQISFQYALLFIPFVFLATALALAALRGQVNGRARLAGAIGGIAMATFLTTRVWGAMPPGDKFRGGFRDIPTLRAVNAAEKQKARDLAELVAKIPKDAAVAVSEMEHPHVSTRLLCLTLRIGYDGADYILYGDDSGSGGADQAAGALASGQYEVLEKRPASRLTLLRKKPVPVAAPAPVPVPAAPVPTPTPAPKR